MADLFAILSRPDNLPILGLLILFPLLTIAMLIHGRRRDRLQHSAAPPSTSALPAKVQVWPHLLKRELAATLAVLTLLVVWSLLADAPLERLADPAETSNPAKAPWYFLGLQELLVYFDPWIAGVLLPLLIAVGLAAIPYLDPNPEANGRYTLGGRPLAMGLFLFGFTLWTALIVVGTFCRGPGWAWFWPWEPWDTLRAAHTTELTPLPELLGVGPGGASFVVGLALVIGWFGGIAWALHRLRRWVDPHNRNPQSRLAFFCTAFMTAAMLGVVVKILLRLLFDVNYIVVVPWLLRTNI